MYPRHKQLASNVASEDVHSLIRVLYCVAAYNDTGTVLASTLKVDGARTLSFAKYLDMDESLIDIAASIKARVDLDEEDLVNLGTALSKAARTALQAEVKTVSQEDLKMLRGFAAVFKSQNENALKYLERNASLYGNGEIISSFVKDKAALPSQPELQSRLTKLVKQLVGKNEPVIQPSEVERIKAEEPELYKEYVRLRREFNGAWKAYIANMVRSSGHKYLPYDKVVQALAKDNIINRLPHGFVGMIDDLCHLYTTEGKEINGFPGSDVIMNPEYDPKLDNSYVYRMTKAESSSGMGAYAYTKAFTKKQTEMKHDNVRQSLTKIDSVRKKWLGLLKAKPDTQLGVVATILELLYKFSARIGSVGNQTEGKSTYGISTLLRKHITVAGNGLIIKYPGKAAGKGGAAIVPTVHKLMPTDAVAKLLIRNINEYLVGKENKEDRVFTFEDNGKVKPVTGNMVNLWFRSAMGSSHAHVHMLRHTIANRMFEELLDQTKFKANASQSEMEAAFKTMVTKIGAALGHRAGVKVTPMTAISNYISPDLMLTFFQTRGYRVPNFLKKFLTVTASTYTVYSDDEEFLEGEGDPTDVQYSETQVALMPNMRTKVLDEQMLSDNIVVRSEDNPSDYEPVARAYTTHGDLIGTPEFGKELADLGINPQKIDPSDSTCSIGKSTDGKWYGFVEGHPVQGFTIGDKHPVEEGEEHIIQDDNDAKEAAKDYVTSLLNPKDLLNVGEDGQPTDEPPSIDKPTKIDPIAVLTGDK